MDEKREAFSRGYYIQFFEGAPGFRDYYINSDSPALVEIYKSLDKSHGNPPVEHVIKVGTLQIPNVRSMSIDILLQQIRMKILRIDKKRRET